MTSKQHSIIVQVEQHILAYVKETKFFRRKAKFLTLPDMWGLTCEETMRRINLLFSLNNLTMIVKNNKCFVFKK